MAGALAVAGLAFTAAPAGAVANVTEQRIEGADRFATAANVCDQVAPAGAANVLLATGRLSFADALTASGLAGDRNTCILLTEQDSLPAATSAQLTQMKSLGTPLTSVTILGGLVAVGQAVQDQVTALGGLTVNRIDGADRFDTARDTATAIGTPGAISGAGTVILANGENRLNGADAMAVGPVAARGDGANPFPILLTNQNSIPTPTLEALAAPGVDNVIVLGGTDAISAAVATQAGTAAGDTNVRRVFGPTREDTSVQIAGLALEQGLAVTEIFLANGRIGLFSADALVSGPLGDVRGAATLLTSGVNTLGTAAQTYLDANSSRITTVTAIGGTDVISQAVLDAAEAAAEMVSNDQVAGSSTSRPELVSAAIVSTTTAGQATVSNPAGTVVAYTFDEPLTAFLATGFAVYNAAAVRTSSAAPNVTISSTNNRVVNVLYPGIATPAAAAALTTATVELGAATDTALQTSPEGDAAIGTGGTNTLTAGMTAAPDLQSVGGFRATLVAGTVAVDFTFDQAAFVQVGGAPPTGAGLFLVSTDGRLIECTQPAEPSSGNTAPSGLNVPGGNGTVTITATCGQFPVAPGLVLTTATSSNTARGIAAPGAVGTTPSVSTVNGVTPAACGAANAGGTINRCNPLQATQTPDQSSTTPDLTTASFTAATNPAGFDQVNYTFDTNVQPGTVVAGNFGVYSNNGVETLGGAVGPPAPQVNGNQVAVFFPFGTLANAVGASARAGAVTDVAGANPANQDDEVAVSNPASTTITPGSTGAPDLTSVALASTTVGFVTTFSATYTFDEALGAAVTAAGVAPQLFLHLADGSRMGCTAAANVTLGTGLNGLTTSQVRCNNFTFVAGQSGTNAVVPATAAQVGSTVLGTVNQQAAPAAGDLADAGGAFTPEGAALTTGGTGTPA